MKSGTTNIMLYLQNHPQLRTSEDLIGWPQESRYFSAAHDPEAAGRNWRFYLRKYPPATDGVLDLRQVAQLPTEPENSFRAGVVDAVSQTCLVCVCGTRRRELIVIYNTSAATAASVQAEGAVFRSKAQ